MDKILSFVVTVWLCGVTVAAPDHNWQYAREEGFVKWIFLGEFVATGRAFRMALLPVE